MPKEEEEEEEREEEDEEGEEEEEEEEEEVINQVQVSFSSNTRRKAYFLWQHYEPCPTTKIIRQRHDHNHLISDSTTSPTTT